ncbi:peptidase M24 [Blastomyces dermatitidis ER-3]|uniref:Probable Xaa-Pro aminopeptidase P n=1 Tax=Ajellomyces dermatitidis (strain ER-3 / ATCC MYA-2586) TaxID=559297 RepID=A0ABP2EK30_AJEDR|nr:peptidase M24 [Blastomyces dermatitidis ER-3]EEQ83488.2 peptidase M24 [Blastomyces dermatitidis ER-3]
MANLKQLPAFKKALHFSEEELQGRRNRALEIMKREKLDGFIMTKQESLYYFTGFDTFGYVFFQAMYFHNDGRMRLITRLPDLRQALYTSVLKREDILIRSDAASSNPVSLVPEVLKEFGINSPAKRIGYEPDSCTLNLRIGKLLLEAVEGLCTLVDHSNLFGQELRIIKSPTEMNKIRKAAYLADFAVVRALKLAKPGAYEGGLWREIVGTVYEGGGDDPANENILISGNKGVLTRYSTGKSRIERQVTLEHAGVYKHYHACLMRTIPIGGITKLARRMHEVNVLQMKAAMEALKPGRPIGKVAEAYARVADENGFREQRFDACGYSMGATFAPTWMDYPMNGILYSHYSVDMATDTASSIGQTVEVTDTGCVPLSKLPFYLTRKQTIAAWKKIQKKDYGFTEEEEDDGENLQDVELSDGDIDAEDYDVEYDFSTYQPAA